MSSVRVVVPRVLPLFIDDVQSASHERRLAHLDAFTAAVPQAFQARFEPPDVVELIEFLIQLTQAEHAAPGATPEQIQAQRLRAVRCLHALFADARPHVPHTFKAVRTLAGRIGAERAARREELQREYEAELARLTRDQRPPEEPTAIVAANASTSQVVPAEETAEAPATEDAAGDATELAAADEAAEKPPQEEGAEQTEAQPRDQQQEGAAEQQPAPEGENGDAPADAEQPSASPSPTAGSPTSVADPRIPLEEAVNGEEAPRVTCPLPDDPTATQPHEYTLDEALEDLVCRGTVLELLRQWDAALVDVGAFTERPQALHAYLPFRMSQPARVFRDFARCTRRPKLTRPWGPSSYVHIKTNIPAQSDIMYRFVVEGYNYGVNAPIFSDVVGCTNRRWKDIGRMTDYGWPEGWDAAMTNDYAAGCAISQYYSRDRYLVLRLKAKSFFSVGFSVSAWLVFHGYGEGFLVAANTYHQDDDL